MFPIEAERKDGMMVGKKKWMLASVCLLMGFFFAGRVGAQDWKYRMTCVIPYKPDTVFWTEMKEGMDEAASDLKVALTAIYTESAGDLVTMDMNSALETAILVKTDAIILAFGKDADEDTKELLKRARKEGILVLFIDNDSDRELRDTCVTIDNKEAGKALSSLALGQMKEGQKALLMYTYSMAERENIAGRMAGLMEGMGEDRLLAVGYEKVLTDAELGRELERILQENPEVGVIFALHERETVTAAQFLAREGLAESVGLYGFDDSQAVQEFLREGLVRAVIGQRQTQMGYEAVATAVRMAEGEKEEDLTYIDFQVLEGGEGNAGS